jgi:hypothetical protein
VSASPPDAPAPPEVPSGTLRCPRCGADVPHDQDWCLSCGLAARTRVAATPRWKIPLALAATVAALALAALAIAFVDLTKDPETVTAPATAPAVPTTPPAATVPPGTPPPATTPPVPTVTVPPTDVPGATTPEPPTATAPAAPDAPAP